MKVAILFDTVTDGYNNFQFDSLVETLLENPDCEVKVLCRGIEGRTGDRYDTLRGRSDVFWSNGMPPLMEVELKLGWKPDMILNNTSLYQNSAFFAVPEILL